MESGLASQKWLRLFYFCLIFNMLDAVIARKIHLSFDVIEVDSIFPLRLSFLLTQEKLKTLKKEVDTIS